jgi:hypothetical protein
MCVTQWEHNQLATNHMGDTREQIEAFLETPGSFYASDALYNIRKYPWCNTPGKYTLVGFGKTSNVAENFGWFDATGGVF